ncbi:MAG: phytoene desaturase, partial [Candidatus Lokiarchaeota archaeon]|nr:phytoene desaturase [Candidatus Lokiarchaeota archaeon]
MSKVEGRRVAVIGAGFSGLSSAALLAKEGFDVTILEKNDRPGGRAMVWKEKGYSFDMGPSWYMMVEAFEDLFAQFGKKPEDYYETIRLDPSYRVFFSENESFDLMDDVDENIKLFDRFEKNGGEKLKEFLTRSQKMYDIAFKNFIYKDYWSFRDLLDKKLIIDGLKLKIFTKLKKYVDRFFITDKAKKIVSYHVAFVGASPPTSPAVYSMLAHVDMNLGIWYPIGGFGAIVDAIMKLGLEQGVKIKFNTEVTKIIANEKGAQKIIMNNGEFEADIILNTGDYHHGEMNLLDKKYRTYDEKYWEKKIIAPSSYLVYLGLNKKLNNFLHHNFYFNSDWDKYFDQLFENPEWPQDPSIYITVPSQSDPSLVPAGGELMTILVLVSPDLEDEESFREKYFDRIIEKVESLSGESIKDSIVVKRIVAHEHFKNAFNAYKGTALSMAHTLFQTAIFRPHHKSETLNNLYYAGMYTHPGVGVPVSIISAQLACEKIIEDVKNNLV